jgi:MFS transporter, ACS family, glucarate transporter
MAPPTPKEPATRHRHRVLGFLSLLSVITYLDRVCISIAGPRMQDALSISPEQWGWVTGVFTLAYAAFEIPSGAMGDRIGPRRVLTRIVIWWSAFTALTGAVSNYVLLLIIRFAFGVGEAGAYPNIGVTIARWFPLATRTQAWGIVLMCAQLGGAMAPFIVVPMQKQFGWRASFFLFGLFGVAWAIAWFWWFRDTPAEMPDVSADERAEVTAFVPARHGLPWAIASRSGNLLTVMTMVLLVGWSMAFFQSWLGTYLVRGRGFTETGLLLASLPFLVGAAANVVGGFVGDALITRLGLRWGRRSIGIVGYGSAAVFVLAATLTPQNLLAVVFLSLAYGGITICQPALMGTCLDIGGKYSGAVTGAMNTAAYTGAFLSSVAYGYIVRGYGYEAPFVPIITFLALGALLWLKVDAQREVAPEARVIV